MRHKTRTKITFIIGGANSGKTSFALELLNKAPKEVSKIYLATGEAFDEEMKEKIEHHKKERLGMDIQTLEEPWDLQKAWSEISSDSVVLLDCLTTWTTNLLFHHEKNGCPNHNPKTLSKQDLTLLVQKHFKREEMHFKELIIVTNELGLGGLPQSKEGRRLSSCLGWVNQLIGKQADTAWIVLCGIPRRWKP